MSASFGQTAVLIFTRTPTQEAAAKTFDHQLGKSGNQAIAQRLIRQTIATAKRTQLPVFVHSSALQCAHTFGENLANAFESVFAKGYSKVIAIGNDCPDLSSDLLLKVSSNLSDQNLVLGPANDGGVYLIGIQQNAYQRQAFIDLPWETPQLQAGWKQYLPSSSSDILWLEAFNDLDHVADFKALLVRLPQWSLLKKQLLSILASLHIALTFDRWKLPSLVSNCIPPLRGPPSC